MGFLNLHIYFINSKLFHSPDPILNAGTLKLTSLSTAALQKGDVVSRGGSLVVRSPGGWAASWRIRANRLAAGERRAAAYDSNDRSVGVTSETA